MRFMSNQKMGHRLTEGPHRLLVEKIEEERSAKRVGKKVYYYEKTSSTNDRAFELISENPSEGTLMIAEEQTRGRGRLGKKWHSARFEDLLFSVILKPKIESSHVSLMTMMAAVAMAESMAVWGLEAKIKWPNDVYVNDQKISGILAEVKQNPNGIQYVILGMGINVNMNMLRAPSEIRNTATSMAYELGKTVNRNEVLGAVLDRIEENYQLVKSGLYEKIRDKWSDRSYLTGRWVEIVKGTQNFEGVVVGTDLRGELLLSLENGCLESFQSGDVRVKYGG